MLLLFGFSAPPAGQLLYLSPAVRVRQIDETRTETLQTEVQNRSEEAVLHRNPRAADLPRLSRSCRTEEEVVFRLRGVRLSASPHPCGANK